MRCRWDVVGDRLLDYKSTVNAEPAAFAKSANDLGYHLQDAHYDAMAQLCDMPAGPLVFIAQEKEPPYMVSVVQLGDESRALGQRLRRRAINLWAEAQALDEWPGYPDQITTIDLPTWAFTQEEAA